MENLRIIVIFPNLVGLQNESKLLSQTLMKISTYRIISNKRPGRLFKNLKPNFLGRRLFTNLKYC